MFFNELHLFGDNVALIDCQTKQKLTYIELEKQSNSVAQTLGFNKELVFIEAQNSIDSVVAYIGALKANKVIYLLDDMNDAKSTLLIELYQPNIIISEAVGIERKSELDKNLHQNLTLLLSTSGSTGTPKFVKLSQSNLQSNAVSIAEYLKLNTLDVAMSHLKLHYSYGLSILHSHLVVGATTAFTTHGVLDDGFWLNIKDFSATSFAGVPYTFETLAQKKFDLTAYDSLRYITQAGGKLEPDLVKQYANLVNDNGPEFYVMYGQTEASPRISYLPPELANQFPSSIGRAIPGGILKIIDDDGNEINQEDIAGELAYQGDNVMMGYAEKASDLSTDNTPDILLTGDIACKASNGLFYIVGRTKRFVKLFGLRINLDDVQSFVKTMYQQSAVAGNDDHIVIAVEESSNVDKPQLINILCEKYTLPKEKFKVSVFDSLPLLVSGKYDYKALMTDEAIKIGFFTKFINKVIDILGLNTEDWDSITALFSSALQLKSINDNECFNNLDTDSLSFVQLSIELEHCLGNDLPENWQVCSIAALDVIYQKNKLI
jgi:acyl-CoA synthetase (AMP-forming)/AMP-acid ligase II